MPTVSRNVAFRNALSNAWGAQFPAGSFFRLYTGAAPGASAAATGTLLAEITLPASPWAAASGGQITSQGTWTDAAANGNGVAGYARLVTSDGTLVWEGDVTATGGGGAVTLNNTTLATGQPFSITSFTVTTPAS